MLRLAVAWTALAFSLGVSTGTSSGAILAYSNETEFLSEMSGLALETFDTPFTKGSFVTFDGFTASRPLADGLAYADSEFVVTGGALVLAAGALGKGALTFDFASNISAFGVTMVDAGSSHNLANGYSVTVSSMTTEGELQQVLVTVPPDLPEGNTLFFGFGATSGTFSSVVFSSESVADKIGWDNLHFGMFPAPVPEPAALSIWSVLCGLGLIVARRRRKAP